MRLSMWILADWLKKYNPQVKIQEGRRTLRNIRLFSDGVRIEALDAYIGSMREFIDEDSDQIICVQGHDMFYLETEDMNETFNEALDAFDYYNSWSDDLHGKVRQGVSLQELLENSLAVFSHPLILCDPGYLVIAQAGMEDFHYRSRQAEANLKEMQKNGIMLLETILSINNDPRIRVNSRESYHMDYEALGSPCICRNLYGRNRHIGWLICIYNGEVSPGLLQLLDELGDIIEYWSDVNDEQQQLLSYDDIFQQILSGERLDPSKQLAMLRSIGWFPEDSKQIIALDGKESYTTALRYFYRKLGRLGSSCFTITIQDRTVLIINRRLILFEEFMAKLKDFMSQTNTFCGISPEFTDVFDMEEPISLALSAVRYGPHTTASAVFFDECALSCAVDFLHSHFSNALIHPALHILKEYDGKNHTVLYETLKEYLDCERNYVRTAEKLFIHRNTLLYRLKRIQELTNTDLDDADVRLHIQLSYRLRSV
ncbi:MAG: helix-turn-helix domain-containing protein [Clostridiales bacterium]|nr:helix-turn-helix domain-containing protein [Clostridiales bacterium]